MLPPPAYTEARLWASYHVQVEFDEPQILHLPDWITINGVVRNVFRGGEELGIGDPVQFQIAVCEGDDFPTGADWWLDRKYLEGAKYIEVFLSESPPNCGAASDSMIIDGISEEPQMEVPTEKQVAAEWAAFYGRPRWWVLLGRAFRRLWGRSS